MLCVEEYETINDKKITLSVCRDEKKKQKKKKQTSTEKR